MMDSEPVSIGVVGAEDAAQSTAIKTRVRGAIIEVGSSTASLSNECGAVAVLESNLVEPSLIERCLNHRKHVLLAAPTEWTAAVLDDFSRIAAANRVQLAILNPDRFLPSRKLLWQQLGKSEGTASGREFANRAGHSNLGKPGLVRMHRWEPMQDGEVKSNSLPTRVIRSLDTICALIGELPDVAYAMERSIQHDSILQVHLGFAAGQMAILDHAACLPAGDGYESLSVIGSDGAAYVDDHQNMQLLYRGGHPQSVRTSEAGKELVSLIQAFVDGLRSSTDLSSTVAAWRGTLSLAEAVRQSLESHAAVTLQRMI